MAREGPDMSPFEILSRTSAILLFDWPSRELPEGLVRAGFQVTVRSGPGPEDYSAYEPADGEVVVRRVGRPPAKAELVYVYRPLSELPGILQIARQVGASVVWRQSGLDDAGRRDPEGSAPAPDADEARALVEAAGLAYLDAPCLGEAARQFANRLPLGEDGL
jgi:hypothetical protein